MNKYTYSGKRKKRSLSPWNEEDEDILNKKFMKMKYNEKHKRETETETELEVEMRSYGSQLRYECGLARRVFDPEAEEFYDES